MLHPAVQMTKVNDEDFRQFYTSALQLHDDTVTQAKDLGDFI